MIKKLSKIFSIIIIKLDEILFFLIKKRFRFYLQDELREKSVSKIIYKNKKYFFFNPSNLTYWRFKTFTKKEPETLNWIENFKIKKPIFWDIGANIGLYSIYAAKIKAGIEVVAFEPSGLNIGILEKNLTLNKVESKIKIFSISLSDKPNNFQYFYESSSEEGGALNNFGRKIGFDGKKIVSINKYNIFGTTIDKLIHDKVLKKPNYMKLDVDGNEHLILNGAKKTLNSEELLEILVEVNEAYTNQFKNVYKILKKNRFKLISKDQSVYAKNSKFEYSYNCIFKKL